MRLSAGSFLGQPLRLRESGGFVLTYYEYEADVALPRHEHQQAYISFPLRGSYEEHYGRRERQCGAGRMLFHPCGEAHADCFGSAGATIFSVELSDAWLARLRECSVKTNESFEVSDLRAHRAATRLMRLITSNDPLAPLRLQAGALDLLSHLAVVPRQLGTPRWIKDVIDALDASLERPSLAELATVAGVHPVYLARAFRQHHGQTIGEYVRSRRVDRAARMLREGNKSLAEIAAAVGCADQSHLTREFRRFYGVTPAQYRTRC